MNTSTTKPQRQESDRQGIKRWYSPILARPEVGPIGVLILLFFLHSKLFRLNPLFDQARQLQ